MRKVDVFRFIRCNHDGEINAHKEFNVVVRDNFGRTESKTTGWENARTGNGEKEITEFIYGDDDEESAKVVKTAIYEKNPGNPEWQLVKEDEKTIWA